MNVRQSWSRHGEEVKKSSIAFIEVAFVLFGCFSPILIIIATSSGY
jgi:hypothetical protein